MKITEQKANELYKELKEKGKLIKEEKLTPRVTIEKYSLDGWASLVQFFEGKIVLIDEYNHREYIRACVK